MLCLFVTITFVVISITPRLKSLPKESLPFLVSLIYIDKRGQRFKFLIVIDVIIVASFTNIDSLMVM